MDHLAINAELERLFPNASYPAPPVPTGAWSLKDWVCYIESCRGTGKTYGTPHILPDKNFGFKTANFNH